MELKYRAWKKTNSPEMLRDIAFINFNENTLGINYPVSSWTTRLDSESLDNVILMQSTGLKDKNGVEIYEGDVVKYQDRDYSEVFGQGDVYYDGDDCMFKIRCNNVILFFINLLNEELEVIGNIHDKE